MACKQSNARLIAFSTDYVFDGELDRPYHEFDTAGHAHTVYGKTKFAGEELIFPGMPRPCWISCLRLQPAQ